MPDQVAQVTHESTDPDPLKTFRILFTLEKERKRWNGNMSEREKERVNEVIRDVEEDVVTALDISRSDMWSLVRTMQRGERIVSCFLQWRAVFRRLSEIEKIRRKRNGQIDTEERERLVEEAQTLEDSIREELGMSEGEIHSLICSMMHNERGVGHFLRTQLAST